MSFPSQVLSGALSTAQFFLYEAFLGQHFEAVELEGNEPEPGDLFLFRLTSPAGQWLGAYVGVYCGYGEIIHFEGRPPPGPLAFMGRWEGLVSKEGWRQLLRSRSLWRVLRRKGGANLKELKRRVQEAMNADSPPYHPTHSNCVHFALTLLGQGTALQGLSVRSESNQMGSARHVLFPPRPFRGAAPEQPHIPPPYTTFPQPLASAWMLGEGEILRDGGMCA